MNTFYICIIILFSLLFSACIGFLLIVIPASKAWRKSKAYHYSKPALYKPKSSVDVKGITDVKEGSEVDRKAESKNI